MPIWAKILLTVWALCGFTGLIAFVGSILLENEVCEKVFPYAWSLFAGMFFVAALVSGVIEIWH